MKLVVFAHTPPPLHGQSYMVQLMLEGFGGDRRNSTKGAPEPRYGIQCYHVNAQLSKNLEDVGMARGGKLFALLGHCLQAVWCRFRYGASTLYYVPAPGKRAALYRDWLVMAFCRPFFKKIVFHWHATSLSKWLEMVTNVRTRGISYRLMGRVDLSIALSRFNRFNAEKLWPRKLAVVANGIPDPCPEFAREVLPRRMERLRARQKVLLGQTLSAQERKQTGVNPEVVNILFLAHCTAEKGLFDAVHAVLLANEELQKAGSPLRFQLTVAGAFQDATEKTEFDALLKKHPGASAIQYAGFIRGDQKVSMLRDADLLCFPSHWENQPVSVIEALAFGLPVLISDLPSVREMVPVGYAGVAEVKNPSAIAAVLPKLAAYDGFAGLRRHFEFHFTLENFRGNLAQALKSVESDSSAR